MTTILCAHARKVRLAGGLRQHQQAQTSARRTYARKRLTLDNGQAPTALEAACLQHLAPVAGEHPLHKAMLTLSRDAFWLPGSLHGVNFQTFPRSVPNDYNYAVGDLSNPNSQCLRLKASICSNVPCRDVVTLSVKRRIQRILGAQKVTGNHSPVMPPQ